MRHDQSLHDDVPKPFWGSRYSIGLIVFSSIAAYFLLSEHRAHFFSALPFLLLLACPLMHVFMHHGHGGHTGRNAHQPADEQDSDRLATAPAPKTEERP